MFTRLLTRLFLLAVVTLPAIAGTPTPYCRNYRALLSPDPLNVGVHFATEDRAAREAFISALDYWQTVLDLTWHADDSAACAIELQVLPVSHRAPYAQGVYQVGGAHLPQTPQFEGIVYYNPDFTHDDDFAFVLRHELGHIFGLIHNPSQNSLMFRAPVANALTTPDYLALAARHCLRAPRTTPKRLFHVKPSRLD